MASEQDCYILLDIDGVLLPIRSVDEAAAAAPAEQGVGGRDPLFAFPDRCLAALSRIISSVEESSEIRRRCHICLSSTWRATVDARQHILDEFHQYAERHPESPLGEIRGFDLTTSLNNFSVRQWEIMEWVQQEQHRRRRRRRQASEVASDESIPNTSMVGKRAHWSMRAADNDSCNFSWVVLDDDDSCVNDKRFKDLCAPHTVLTDSRLGLTDTDADLAIAVLLSDVDASSRGAQQQAPDEKKKKMKKKKSERR